MDSNPGQPSPSNASPRTPRDRGPGRGRRRRRAGVLLAAGALVVAGLAGFQATAGALPPRCDDGSPPPCDIPDPTTTTTTTPHPDVWNARVTVLDQSGPASFNRTISGSWGGNGYSTPTGQVTWSDPATKLEGNLGLQAAYLPPGFSVGLRMFESGSSGRFCRSMPMAAIPPTGRTVRVLVAPPTVKTPTDLQTMANGVTGTFHPDSDTSITIQHATLTPQAGGLQLVVSGTLWSDVQWPLPNVDATFDYTVMLHLHPGTSITDPNQVMTVSADVGDLNLQGNGWTDDAEIWWNGNAEPQFRTNVAAQATDAVNNSVSAQADVGWFRSLGYVVSVRNVTTSTSGVTVFPSLCKVD